MILIGIDSEVVSRSWSPAKLKLARGSMQELEVASVLKMPVMAGRYASHQEVHFDLAILPSVDKFFARQSLPGID